MRRMTRALALAAPACLIAATLISASANAAPALKVTTGSDDGAGSLRQAIEAASSAGGGTIVVSNGVGTIELQAEVTYTGTGPLTIQGAGATVTADDEGGPFHLVRTTGGGALTIRDLTLTGADGAGLVVEVPTAATTDQVVSLVNVVASDNALNGVYVDDCETDLAAEAPAQCDDDGSGSAAGVVLDLNRTTISSNGFRGPDDFDGIRVNERGAGSITATFVNSDVIENAADGIELDEDETGGVTLKVRGGEFLSNGSQPQLPSDLEDAIDIDERGDGNVDTDLVGVTVKDSRDENLDFNEMGSGDLISRLQQVTIDNATGGRGYDLEEGDEGSLFATVTNVVITNSDSDGMRAQERGDGDLTVDVNQSRFVDNGEAGLEVDQRGGGVGAATVKNSAFEGNDEAIEDDGDATTVTLINVTGA